MKIEDYLRILRTRWMIVVVCFLLVTAGAVATSFLLPPKYAAGTRLFVTVGSQFFYPAGPDDRAGLADMYQGGLFAAQRAISYTELLTSEQVARQTIAALNLDGTTDELIAQVKATSTADSVLITLRVEDTSAERAARIANELSDQFVGVVGALERTYPGQPKPEVAVAQRASAPDQPFSPRKKLNIALGMMVGLLLGFGLAVLRDRLDKTVRTVGEIEGLTGSDVIGQLPAPVRSGNAKPATPTNSELEAYRNLRTSLQFRDVDNPPRVIVVTSTTHREERHSAAVNLGIVLGKGDSTVALLQADFRFPDAATDVYDPASGLSDVLAGALPLDWSIRRSQFTGVFAVSGGPTPPNPSELLGSDAAYMAFNDLRTRFDFVVVDGPPLLPYTDAALVARQTDGAVLIVEPGVTLRRQLTDAVAKLAAVDARLLGIVVRSPGHRGMWPRFRRSEWGNPNRRSAVAVKDPVGSAVTTVPG